MMTRTLFAAALLFVVNASRGQTIEHLVVMRTTSTATMWDNNEIDIYGFASTLAGDAVLPGKILYCNGGDTVIVNALNFSQGDHHTIHPHGLDVDTRNDGDPMTSFSLSHMQDTTYTFVAKHAGTYIYHCHVADVVHVQMGMYGLVVVKAADGANTAWTGGPAFSKDYKWLMSELDESWHDSVPEHDMATDTVHLPPYEPNYYLINGKSEQQLLTDDSTKITGQQNEPIYLRLCNIGFFNNRVIFPSWLHAKTIDSDGRPLPNEINSDTVDVMPGERYGVMLTPSAQLDGFVQVDYVNMNTGVIWDTQEVPVSISGFYSVHDVEDRNRHLSVHPNPSSTHATLTYTGVRSTGMTLCVYDATGRIAMKIEWPVGSSNITVATKAFPAGIYRCALQDKSGHILGVATLAHD